MSKLFVIAATTCSLLVVTLYLPAQVQGAFVNTGSMNAAREGAAQMTLSSGKALVAGGNNGTNVLASTEIYDPATGVWTLTGSMAIAREWSSSVMLKNGKVLVVGGLGANVTFLASAELYDPGGEKWSSAGALTTARWGHTATLLHSGKVLVAGGCNGSPCTYLGTSELYDPTTNKWTATGSLVTPRASHTATLLSSGEVLVVGGSDGVALQSCELYNPGTGKWISAPSMSTARFAHAATVLESGRVLVTGGTTSRFPMSSAEIYDPTANKWAGTGKMTSGHYGHTATLLPDSTVLVAGGEGQAISCGKACTSFIPTAKAEIFNEATEQFAATASMTRAMAYHTTTLVGPGQALAAGGIGYTSTCCVDLNTSELYTPLTFKFSSMYLDFGFREVSVASQPQTVTVTNVSFHSAAFTSIAPSGDYSQTNNCPITPNTLGPGKSCTTSIKFKPTETGTRNGSVTLKDNAPGSPQQIITMTGTGEPFAFAVTPSSYTFPSIPPGNSEMTTFTVLADAAKAISIASISISPADGVFTLTDTCPGTLQPAQSCTVTVVFKPPDSIAYSATLSVTDTSNQTQTAALMGSGIN